MSMELMPASEGVVVSAEEGNGVIPYPGAVTAPPSSEIIPRVPVVSDAAPGPIGMENYTNTPVVEGFVTQESRNGNEAVRMKIIENQLAWVLKLYHLLRAQMMVAGYGWDQLRVLWHTYESVVSQVQSAQYVDNGLNMDMLTRDFPGVLFNVPESETTFQYAEINPAVPKSAQSENAVSYAQVEAPTIDVPEGFAGKDSYGYEVLPDELPQALTANNGTLDLNDTIRLGAVPISQPQVQYGKAA